jgi:GT2 family glycosyltransferase/glycosyltransferase involved in cell wall biosynthesis
MAQNRFGSWIINRYAPSFSYWRRHSLGNSYHHWLEVNSWNERRQEVLQQAWLEVGEPAKLSLIMPVFDPPGPYLQRALESVRQQIYPHWELCLVNDGGTDPEIHQIIESWQSREPRLKVRHARQNTGVSGATNTAAAMAQYDHLLFMDHDDELAPDALAEVALCLVRHPRVDVLYSDDDKIDEAGRRFDPHFKPDWSPELLLSSMYLGHLFGVRRDLYRAVGGMRIGFEGSQDYDLALRVTEQTSQIWHLPKILYHWRVTPGSTALSGHEKPYSFEAGRRALQEALERRGLNAVVHHPPWAYQAGCGIYTHEFPDVGPSVAIIIPTKNQLKMVKACLNGLAKTRYQNYQVYLIDNDSDDPDTLDYLHRLPHTVWRLSCPEGRFNFAYLINRAAERTTEDYLLLLNNDVEVISPAWLSQMVGYLGIAGVGAVGARLLFPDGRVQHAGVLHGIHLGKPGHAFKLTPGQDWGYQAYAKVTRNYSAVTAACMLTPRRLFQQSGGFDETNFAIAYNDVDYCYRLLDSGYRMVYCPSAELVHHEGATRGNVDYLPEVAAFVQKYRHRYDPYYNPNLSLQGGDFLLSARTSAPENLRPIRVLMCTPNLNLEGAPQFMLELARGLVERGVIEPVIHSPVDGPLRQAFEAAHIPVWLSPLPLPAVQTLENYDRLIEALAQEIGAKDRELIFGNTLLTFYAIAAADRLRLPCLWHIHESDPEQHLRELPRVAARQVIRNFHFPYQVIFCSETTQALYNHLNDQNNFMTLPNVLDYDRFARILQPWKRDDARRRLGLQPEEVMVLLLGTICERKGQMDLLEAIPLIHENFVRGAKFFLVGDRANPYSQKLHVSHASLDHKWQNRVTIIPETEDVGLYYGAADIFLCTSRIESFPRVILEAMYCRLPIITTPVFGVTEMVRDGCSAIFYRPGDYRQLARLMETLITEPTRRRQLGGNAALGLAALPDYADMLNSYAKLFREAFMSGQPRTGRSEQVSHW